MAGAMQPTEPSAGPERPDPPPIEAVQAAFPQLDILEFLGQGGMGWVFKARQPKLNRLVALKLLPASLAERDPAFAGRFDREGQLLARLHHPNIVAVHDSGAAGDFFYLLMEYVEGVNLRQAMRSSRFTPAQALAIVPHICDALQYAHDEGVLHRDIKPENILLDARGRVKLVDFGIAKLIGSADPTAPGATQEDPALNLTQSGTTLGTPSYMAPEQRDTPANVDHRADIYSLGVVFYEILTGELPTGSFAPPSSKSDTDPRVDAIVQQALEHERTRRQNSAGEMKTQVETVAAHPEKAESSESETPRHVYVHAILKVLPITCAWGLCMLFLLPSLRYIILKRGAHNIDGAVIPFQNFVLTLFSPSAPSILFCCCILIAILEILPLYRLRRRAILRFITIAFNALALIGLISLAALGIIISSPNDQPETAYERDLSRQSFGPVIQRDITIGNDSHSFYSIDKGDYVPGPTSFHPPDGNEDDVNVAKMWQWLTESDVDFLAMRNGGRPGLVLSDMVISSCDESAFDNWTPQDLAQDVGFHGALAAQFRPNFNKPLNGNHGGNIILAFQTRYDRVGMVQVLAVTNDPPGIRIRYKLLQEPSKIAASSPIPAPSSTVAQSKRMRFEPRAGTDNLTNWGVYDKPSEWNPNGWAIVARMTMGGIVNAQLPDADKPFCRITLTGGNDDAVTLKVDDLVWKNTMLLNLPRDRPADLTLNRIGYSISYSSIYVANVEPDTAPFAFIVVTGSDSAGAEAAPDPTPSAITDPAASIELKVAEQQLEQTLGKIQETREQMADASLRYGDEHPGLISLKDTLHTLELQADNLKETITRESSPSAAAAVEGDFARHEYETTLLEIEQTQQDLAAASLKYKDPHPKVIILKSKLSNLMQEAQALRAAIGRASPTPSPSTSGS
jgi:serine/threonine protein kinase